MNFASSFSSGVRKCNVCQLMDKQPVALHVTEIIQFNISQCSDGNNSSVHSGTNLYVT